jgi:hypothetical protein
VLGELPPEDLDRALCDQGFAGRERAPLRVGHRERPREDRFDVELPIVDRGNRV